MKEHLRPLLESYNASLPLEQASTIPAAWYTDPAIAALERDGVWGRNWLVAGRVDQVAEPGQYFTLDIAGEPLLIVRGLDGVLRGFFNVCRHHAAAVATCNAGTAQLFRCPYHGWTYGLDGSLKGTPDFAGVCNFDRSRNGLVPIRVEAWKSFVFVCLKSHAPPLMEELSDFPSSMETIDLAKFRFRSRRDYTLNCNWKVYVDNYLDGGYHVPYLHKSLNSVLEYSRYTIENGERFCLQSSPLVKDGANTAVESTRTGDRACYFWLYPNFMINVYGDAMDTNLVLPLGIDRTRVVFDFFFTPDSRIEADASIDVSNTVQAEDVAVCEAVQRGLSSRAYESGRLSVRREAGEHLFHRLLARDLRNSEHVNAFTHL